ncbi:MAG: HNH endonuclease signature motif containing protein [Actinomycetota bacterium]
MNLPVNLRKTSDDSLISELKDLVKREREVLTQVLHYLKELEIRKLYLQNGYPSLFAYLTDELGYSEGAAQRRIQAMRLIKDLPEVEKKIESGELSLSVASQVQGFIQRENTKRKEQKTQTLTPIEKLELVEKLEGTSSRTCETKLAALDPESSIREKTRILTPEKTLIQFIAGHELMAKINRLKSLISHQNPEGRYDILFEKIIELALDKHDPARREKRRRQKQSSHQPGARKEPKVLGGHQATNSPKAPSPSTESITKLSPPPSAVETKHPSPKGRGAGVRGKVEHKRYIPIYLRDKIWERDQGKCQYQNKQSGKVCGSNHLIEIDHRFPFSLDGENSEENLQLRCRAHNQYQTDLIFS